MKKVLCSIACLGIGIFGMQAQNVKQTKRANKEKVEASQQVGDTINQGSEKGVPQVKDKDLCNFTKDTETRAMANGDILMTQVKMEQLRAFVAKDRNIGLNGVFIVKAKDVYNDGVYQVCAGGILYTYYHRGMDGYSRY